MASENPFAEPRELPDWHPEWTKELANLYFSGTTSVFVLSGNTFDLFPLTAPSSNEPNYGTLSEFLAMQLLGRWELIVSYDLSRGLRCTAGPDRQRLHHMVQLADRRIGDLRTFPKDPLAAFTLLDKFLEKNVMMDAKDRLDVAVIFNHAGFLAPAGDRLSANASRNLVTLLNWASSPYLKRLNLAIVLVDTRLANFSHRLTGNPHVATLELTLPEEEERLAFLLHRIGDRDFSQVSDFTAQQISRLTSGIPLTDLDVLVGSSMEGRIRLDSRRFRDLKKELIERQAHGLLEFLTPSWNLDMVVGHTAAKARLREDANLLKEGRLKSVPMGYLICGPVGTGKTFLAQCAAGAVGIPCVILKNFRSKFVGESEGNLERVLAVLRSMGPVLVIVDEADAMLGDRDQSGDSGVGSRVFGMIASQMGDSRYRGRIIWMLLTARPDLLPIDLKRQGRAEIHIPLFYPTEEEEIHQMFAVMARKIGAPLKPEDIPEINLAGKLSGADIEGMVGRAWRRALLAGQESIRKSDLQDVIKSFMPSTETLERELQELAALIECTDREFLPVDLLEKMERLGGRARLQERLNAIRELI